MINISRENIIYHLRGLSDIEFQRLAWLGKIPGVVSSFEEVVCGLYDDSGLGSALESPQKPVVFDATTDEILRRLSVAIDLVTENEPALLINDPMMITVRNLAAEALQRIGTNFEGK